MSEETYWDADGGTEEMWTDDGEAEAQALIVRENVAKWAEAKRKRRVWMAARDFTREFNRVEIDVAISRALAS
jgi:hypothetical protein